MDHEHDQGGDEGDYEHDQSAEADYTHVEEHEHEQGGGHGAQPHHIGHKVDNPGDPTHHMYGLMRAYAELQGHYYGKSEEEHPEDPEVHDALVRIYLHVGHLLHHHPESHEAREILEEVDKALHGHSMGHPYAPGQDGQHGGHDDHGHGGQHDEHDPYGEHDQDDGEEDEHGGMGHDNEGGDEEGEEGEEEEEEEEDGDEDHGGY